MKKYALATVLIVLGAGLIWYSFNMKGPSGGEATAYAGLGGGTILMIIGIIMAIRKSK